MMEGSLCDLLLLSDSQFSMFLSMIVSALQMTTIITITATSPSQTGRRSKIYSMLLHKLKDLSFIRRWSLLIPFLYTVSVLVHQSSLLFRSLPPKIDHHLFGLFTFRSRWFLLYHSTKVPTRYCDSCPSLIKPITAE